MKKDAARSSTDEGPRIRIAWRDDHSIKATWELTEPFRKEVEQYFAIPFADLPLVLRLYDVTDREEIKDDGTDRYTDFDINHQSTEWILYGVTAGLTYRVALGIRMLNGRFYSLTCSDAIS
ncbi:DUF4912 domain-containing protein [Brevibacillus marinus]|jgi:hypothetical protein|uniref:DUF4912 domain-containing protein n=1 Tax=Brevibacillus marinus TaxID=2496837 RepID=UPI000F84B942|nr:DUF4912 domain-containing protein [Brevibacillus marinus]